MRPDRATLAFSLMSTVFAAVGCRQDMHDQPKFEPLEASTFFPNGMSSRDPVAGTVARAELREERVFFTGLTEDDRFAEALPMELDRELLDRGRNRFNAFCSPCHGRTGNGQGMVVQRGFKYPNSFHEERLRQSAVGYFFSVMTNGFGQMSSYAAQLRPGDRWAVAAYIRALQLSQDIPVNELSSSDLQQLEESATGSPDDGDGHNEAHGR